MKRIGIYTRNIHETVRRLMLACGMLENTNNEDNEMNKPGKFLVVISTYYEDTDDISEDLRFMTKTSEEILDEVQKLYLHNNPRAKQVSVIAVDIDKHCREFVPDRSFETSILEKVRNQYLPSEILFRDLKKKLGRNPSTTEYTDALKAYINTIGD